MTWTITGDSAHTPQEITEYSSSTASLNVVDMLLDSTAAMQLRDAGPQSGRFKALFPALADALACRADIAKGHILTLADSDYPDLDMDFVLADGGNIEIESDNDVDVWFVSCDFQEVP